MLATILAAAIALVAASGPQSWLDAKTLVPWNTVRQMQLPARPGAPDAELARGGRCASTVRPPTSTEDHALVTRGWSLAGPYQRYGETSIVVAMAGADGMCRPMGYQAFVFVDGWYAGTLSPRPMDARTDGALAALSIPLYDASNFTVDYVRYAPADALCCPHGTTTVSFKVKSLGGRPHVVPVAAGTQKNSQRSVPAALLPPSAVAGDGLDDGSQER